MVAQTQKVLFRTVLTAAARPLCVHWTAKTAAVEQQVVQRRQSGGRTIIMVAQGLSWPSNGGTVVATVFVQLTLLVGQRRHSGSTREAEASHKMVRNVYDCYELFYRTTNGRPMCIYSATTVMRMPSSCLLWATDLLVDLCATGLNMLKTSRRPWRPWRGLSVLCATLERPRPPFCLLCAFNDDLTSFMVAQGRHKGRSPCV